MSTPKPTERRFLSIETAELRVERRADGKITVVGYAAPFNKLSLDLGGFREKIRPGAFSKVIANADCRALVNHNNDLLMGRTTAGTLLLAEDTVGLRFEYQPPPSSIAEHYNLSIEQRNMTGCSFQFTVAIDQWDYSGQIPIREIVEIEELFDVGPVTFPAYPDTKVALRSLEVSKASSNPVPVPDPRFNLDHAGYELALHFQNV